jgi:Ca2+-dependent lipid-binding protein
MKLHKRDKSDPYVIANLEDYRLIKTRYIKDDLDPVFDEEFYVPVAHM